jgi:hypothetical protein
MAKGASTTDDDNAHLPRAGWSRESIKKFIDRHYHARVHMSLILAACGLTAMSVSWTLLHAGVHSMLFRYPVAISLAYAVFLIGVWTWLRATGLLGGGAAAGEDKDAPATARKAKSGKSSWFDWIGNSSGGSSGGGGGGSGGGGGGGGIGGITRGGGGSFDGGGASSSFASGTRAPFVAAAVQSDSAQASSASSSSGSSSGSSWGSKAGSSLFDGIDGDGIVLLILALVLIGTVLIASGYLIWCAPDVLTEATFGAGLTGTLARATTNHAAGGWVGGVVRKTWWPFAIVLVAAMMFAGWSASHYPGAATFKQAITMAIHGG